MAVPSLISSGTLAQSANSVVTPTNLTPGLPGTRVNGDVLLLLTSCRFATGVCATPAGWTSIANLNTGANGRIVLFARVVDGTETGPTVAWSTLSTGTSGSPVLAQIACFRGLSNTLASLADVIGATSDQGAVTSPGAGGAAITTLLGNDLVLVLSTRQDDAGTWSTLAAADTITFAKVVATGTTTSGSDMAQEWQYGVRTVPGSVGAKTITIAGGAAAGSTGVQIALKAATVSGAVGQASETDTATAVTRQKSKTLTQPSETDTATAVTRQKRKTLTQPSETDTATAVTRQKRKAITQPSETDTAQAISPAKGKVLGQPSETDTAQPIGRQKRVAIGQAWGATRINLVAKSSFEDDLAGWGDLVAATFDRSNFWATDGSWSLRVTNPAGGVVFANEPFPVEVGLDYTPSVDLNVHSVSQSDALQDKAVVMYLSFSDDIATDYSAYASIVVSGITGPQRLVGPTVTAPAGAQYASLLFISDGVVTAVDLSIDAALVNEGTNTVYFAGRQALAGTSGDTAQPITPQKRVTLGQATETDTATAVTAQSSHSVAVGQASETDTAQALTAQKRKAVTQPSETDTATAVTAQKRVTIGQATEVGDTATPITIVKRRSIGQASEADTAQPITAQKSAAVGQATETDTATGVASSKSKAIGQASETDTAGAITPTLVAPGTISVVIGQAVESDSAGAIAPLVLEVTPGSPANLVAGELFTLPYTANETLTSAVLTLADARQLAMTIGPTALQVLLPPDTPTGPADLTVQAATGSLTFVGIAQLAGASGAPANAGAPRAGGGVTPTGGSGRSSPERRTVSATTEVAMFTTARVFSRPAPAESVTELASTWTADTRPPGVETEVAMSSAGAVRATSSTAGGLPEKVYVRSRKREEALLLSLLDH